jgi:hypothetical protein
VLTFDALIFARRTGPRSNRLRFRPLRAHSGRHFDPIAFAFLEGPRVQDIALLSDGGATRHLRSVSAADARAPPSGPAQAVRFCLRRRDS